MSIFGKRKIYSVIEYEELRLMAHALRKNAHFQLFAEHLRERREIAIRNMQTEKTVNSTNRHFMEAGKLEAMDELLDDLEQWSKSVLD